MNLVDRQLRPARPDAPAHPDSFLRWAEGREGRYELVEGQIVMMTGGSKNHAVITLRIGALLLSRLDQTIYQTCAADLGVRTKAGVALSRYRRRYGRARLGLLPLGEFARVHCRGIVAF